MSEQSFLSAMVGIQNVGLSVRSLDTWGSAEVLKGLSLASASEEDGVFAKRSDLGELVEGEDFSTSLDDSASGLLGDSKSADSELRNGQHSLVVQDVADNDHDLVPLLGSIGMLGQLRQGNRVAGSAALVEALVDDLVELRLGSSAQELVELDEESVVKIGGSGVSADLGLDSASFVQIDAH